MPEIGHSSSFVSDVSFVRLLCTKMFHTVHQLIPNIVEDESDTMSDVRGDNNDVMPNADSCTDEEYEIDPFWPRKYEAAQRNRDEYTTNTALCRRGVY